MSGVPRHPTRAARARHGGAAGFTLIEALIALTLVGMMMAGVFAGLRFGARAWEAGDARIARVQSHAAGVGFLRQLVAGAVPRMILPGGDWVAGLEGTGRRLTLLGPWINPHGPPGLLLFELEKAPGSKGLMLRWRLARQARPEGGDWVGRSLLPEAEEVTFRYFGAWEEGAAPVWRDDWPAGRRLPRLVAITAGGSGEHAPEPIVIALAGAWDG